MVGGVPLHRVGDGLEIGVGEETLEALEVFLDRRVLGVGQRRLEARILHQFPGLQVDAPGLGQALLVAVLVAQLLEEGTLGRHVGGQAQGAVGQRIAAFRVIAVTAPGQLVVGEEAEQPRVVTMVAGGDGDGALGGHGETRVERVGHATPPVEAGLDGGVIALDRQRQRVGHALAGVEGRIAPVAQGIEAPGLETVEAVADPALRVVAAIGARQVGAIEVVPAALVEGTALVGIGLGAVFALAEVAGQGLVVLGQRFEHALTALDVGLAQPRRHRVDPEGEEGMAFRGHQEPAVAALLRAEEAAGLEGLATEPAAIGILLRQLGGPVGQLLLLVLGALLQLFVVLHLVRPVATGVLAIGIHQAVVEGFLLAVLGGAEAPQQHVLRGVRLAQGEGHGGDLAAVQLAVDQGSR
ncbi:hypothetical protein D3C85_832180 [compost metagenome]